MHPGLRRCGIQRVITCIFICCAATVLVISRSSTLVSQRINHLFNRGFTQAQTTLNTTRIFLVETSRKSNLKLRQACAMESASLHHPKQTVTLYSLVPLSQNEVLYQMLLSKPNIKFEVLNLTELFSNTPMKEWHRNDVINGSLFPTEHLSDGIRIAQLWKHGGIYMDTDVITINSLIGLKNTLALETSDDGGQANNAILAFDQHHFFLYHCMADYVAHYTKDSWSMQGPMLMTHVLKKICGRKAINDALNHPEICQGVTILPTKSFYPITYDRLDKFYFKSLNNKENIVDAYTVHLWNKLTKNIFAKPGTGTFLETLVKENCPSTYQFMLQHQMI